MAIWEKLFVPAVEIKSPPNVPESSHGLIFGKCLNWCSCLHVNQPLFFAFAVRTPAMAKAGVTTADAADQVGSHKQQKVQLFAIVSVISAAFLMCSLSALTILIFWCLGDHFISWGSFSWGTSFSAMVGEFWIQWQFVCFGLFCHSFLLAPCL